MENKYSKINRRKKDKLTNLTDKLTTLTDKCTNTTDKCTNTTDKCTPKDKYTVTTDVSNILKAIN